MTDPKTINALAVFAAGYLKRWLEKNLYDKAFESDLGKKLKSLDDKEKYVIEAGLNLLTALFDQKVAGDSVFVKTLKHVGLDAAPEISSRMVKDAKTELKESASSPKEKDLANTLAEMEDQTLVDLLKWMSTAGPEEREEVLGLLSRLSSQNIEKVAKLPPDLLTVFADLFKEPEVEEPAASLADKLNALNDRWEKWLDSWKGEVKDV